MSVASAATGRAPSTCARWTKRRERRRRSKQQSASDAIPRIKISERSTTRRQFGPSWDLATGLPRCEAGSNLFQPDGKVFIPRWRARGAFRAGTVRSVPPSTRQATIELVDFALFVDDGSAVLVRLARAGRLGQAWLGCVMSYRHWSAVSRPTLDRSFRRPKT